MYVLKPCENYKLLIENVSFANRRLHSKINSRTMIILGSKKYSSAFLYKEIISEILLKGDKSHSGKVVYESNAMKENELIDEFSCCLHKRSDEMSGKRQQSTYFANISL